jgi:hypothetical protein
MYLQSLLYYGWFGFIFGEHDNNNNNNNNNNNMICIAEAQL